MINLVLLFSCLCMNFLLAQDMPLSQVLIEGESWRLIQDLTEESGAMCADKDGKLYYYDQSTIFKLNSQGESSVFIKNIKSIIAMQFSFDGKLLCIQSGEKHRLISFDEKEGRKLVFEGLKFDDFVVNQLGWIYATDSGKSVIIIISPEGKVSLQKTSASSPQGISLSTDQSTLLVASAGGVFAWAYRIEHDGTLNHEQAYMPLQTPGLMRASGSKDLGVDAYNRYYVSSEMGIQMFDPTGRLGGVILAPHGKKALSLEFAGGELNYLYIHTGKTIYRRRTKSQGRSYQDGAKARKNFKK